MKCPQKLRNRPIQLIILSSGYGMGWLKDASPVPSYLQYTYIQRGNDGIPT